VPDSAARSRASRTSCSTRGRSPSIVRGREGLLDERALAGVRGRVHALHEHHQVGDDGADVGHLLRGEVAREAQRAAGHRADRDGRGGSGDVRVARQDPAVGLRVPVHGVPARGGDGRSRGGRRASRATSSRRRGPPGSWARSSARSCEGAQGSSAPTRVCAAIVRGCGRMREVARGCCRRAGLRASSVDAVDDPHHPLALSARLRAGRRRGLRARRGLSSRSRGRRSSRRSATRRTDLLRISRQLDDRRGDESRRTGSRCTTSPSRAPATRS
jgi:hypothetical protein